MCCSGQIPFGGSSSAIKLALRELRSWDLLLLFQIVLGVYSDLFKRSVVCVTLRLLAGWQHLGRQTSCSNDAINRTEDSDQRNDCIWNGSLCSQPIMQKTDVRHWPTVPWRPFSQFSLIHLNPYKLFISCTFHRWQQKYPMGFPGKKKREGKSRKKTSPSTSLMLKD